MYTLTINKHIFLVWVGLAIAIAIAIALVVWWHVWQWQVPKAWARIFLGCRAVGIVRRVVVRQPSPVPILFFSFSSPMLSKETISCLR